jgi:Uncharacterized protein (competence- and mitomycin-induced)
MPGYLLPDDITDLAARVVAENADAGRKVALAESCTGGLVAGALTEIADSSSVLDRGFVTYSNEAKMEMLGGRERYHRDLWRCVHRLRLGHGEGRA